MEADIGLVIDPGAERLYVVDDTGVEVPLEKALLLFVKLVAQQAGRGEKIVLPLTVTHVAEQLAGAFDVEVVRTKVSLPALGEASHGGRRRVRRARSAAATSSRRSCRPSTPS